MAPKQQKNTEDTDAEHVSLTQVKDLLKNQRDTFPALLQQQQEMFKDFVKIIMDSINSRLDAITKEVQELKTSIQYTQKEVDEMKITIAKQTDNCNSFQTDIFKICDSLQVILDKPGKSVKKKQYCDGQDA